MNPHIDMQVVNDANGSIMIAENLPFDMKRTFVIYMKVGRQRGGHANYECEQLFTVISGEVVLRVETAKGSEKFHMRQNGRGIYVPAMAWRPIVAKTSFACVLVHASTVFDESDYIRDYEEFKDALQQH